jgi:hypothetical protein
VNDALTLLALQTGAQYNYSAAQGGLINAYAGVGTTAAGAFKDIAGYGGSGGRSGAAGTPYSAPAGYQPNYSQPGPQAGTYYA